MVCQTAKYQAVNSPSKIEGAGGSMKGSLDMAQRVSIGTLSYSPLSPSILEGEL